VSAAAAPAATRRLAQILTMTRELHAEGAAEPVRRLAA
jgi:hypothetical protein